MKWLLGLFLMVALITAALLVPIEGRSLWTRGAVREVARFVAHGLRAGWDAVASSGKDHGVPTRPPPVHSPKSNQTAKAQASAPPRTSREGIVQQAPKETLKAADQQALKDLIVKSR